MAYIRKPMEKSVKELFNSDSPFSRLQLRILIRAMNLLKSNGKIVYSTCSLNPVENEAVVAGALQIHPEFEVVDVSAELLDLTRKPGLETWYPVVNKDLDHFASYEDYISHCRRHDYPKSSWKMTATHWPPGNVKDLNLHRWYAHNMHLLRF